MEFKETELNVVDMVASLLNFIAYLISPILFIWSVNTLFDCEIPFSFKTWLAGLVLIMLIRFHLKGQTSSYEKDYDDYYYDDDDEEEEEEDYYDEDDEDSEERKARLKAKLIAYQDHKNKRKSPSDES
ncbi:hypothetical protein QUF80_16850 [Desulfococcaceae bacterium HSG8]|nr:hypothetical protein [Desulfococcaceae bacterium HSG8]